METNYKLIKGVLCVEFDPLYDLSTDDKVNLFLRLMSSFSIVEKLTEAKEVFALKVIQQQVSSALEHGDCFGK